MRSIIIAGVAAAAFAVASFASMGLAGGSFFQVSQASAATVTGTVQELNSSTFDSTVAASKVPVLVDFRADWCGWCKLLAPEVDKIAAADSGKVLVTSVNVDNSPSLARRYGVQGLPTLVIVAPDGKVLATREGFQPYPALKSWVDQTLKSYQAAHQAPAAKSQSI